MEDAGCGVEGEVLVGRYARRKPARRGSPFYGKHVIWRSKISIRSQSEMRIVVIPVKVLPNISSSGGTSCLGVIVLVMESFDGSMPGRRDNESSVACMAFFLRHDVLAKDL